MGAVVATLGPLRPERRQRRATADAQRRHRGSRLRTEPTSARAEDIATSVGVRLQSGGDGACVRAQSVESDPHQPVKGKMWRLRGGAADHVANELQQTEVKQKRFCTTNQGWRLLQSPAY